MNDNTLMGPWIRRFLLEHLVTERNLARNTQKSYRDTLVLLLPFLATTINTPIDPLTVEGLSPLLVRQFLEHVEKDRSCSGVTRNLRLGAIHSFGAIGSHSPEHLEWCTGVRAVPFKKTAKPTMVYLDKPEMDAVLKAPDRRTAQGRSSRLCRSAVSLQHWGKSRRSCPRDGGRPQVGEFQFRPPGG